ncbi:hypothetical protein EMPS_07369 [Entomortierella parvispora]|uniref:L-type lectin-like domain-containing protein n=1 Tax=Entomortierella parvispora TaxID=205924 RepID=A0A9P3LY38_9FUNG|nr:hypothetical protein EMPS_07369 [Entomortierella parvispora]
MKTCGILLVPVLFLSTALAWGRDAPVKPSSPDDPVLPFENRRHDYKQSLKKPFQYNGAMPFWDHHGNAFVALDFIRLAPSVPRLRGSVWRTTPNPYKEWEVEFSFKAFGQNHVGGKGLAFWYTKERAVDGPVFGNQEKYEGLGVFMDSSDPLNQRTTPVIYGIMNDGTKAFPKNPTANTNSFGGCLRDYKNSPVPSVVRISYIGGKLKVSVDTFNKGRKMGSCFEQKDIELPTGYYFGFSAEAAETGTPDDHDLFSFEVYEVSPPAKKEKPLRPHEAEMVKKGGEVKVDEKDKEAFEELQKMVEEQEKKMKEELDGPSTLSASQIAATVADTQFRIIESLNSIHNKLESLGAPAQAPETTAQGLEDVNKKLVTMAASLHAMESVVQGLVDHILAQGGIKDNQPDVITKVLKDELRNLNSKMEDMDNRQSFNHRQTQRLASSTSWVTYVVFLILLQVVAMSGYAWYKKRVEMSEKKFI